MDAYRARLERALAVVSDSGRSLAGAIEQEMGEASELQQYERASRLQSQLARARTLSRAAYASARDLRSLAWLIAGRCERDGAVRICAVRAGTLAWLGTIPPDADDRLLDEVGDAIGASIAGAGTFAFSRSEADLLGLVCWWLARSRARGETIEAVDARADRVVVPGLIARLRRRARARKAPGAVAPNEEQAFETLPDRAEGA